MNYFSLKKENLYTGVKNALNMLPVSVKEHDKTITVHFQELLIVGIYIKEEVYKIYNVSPEWKKQTTYLCNDAEDGTWFYYVDSMDECIGEVQRLVMFEAKKTTKLAPVNKYNSELRQFVTAELFEKAYRSFIEQADKNAISKKSQGTKKPLGFVVRNIFDGGNFSQHFGQGAASATPYMNWWVVSIYYIPDTGNIVMGIETERYSHLNKMKPLRIEQIGKKKTNVAVFYSTSKENVNYYELYEKFIAVAEEVINLGLR